ncbi:MAG TPA: VOC family protein [Candidatus Eisenbacteria bacterium]|nr:VOC family protein [Candidatus Eisenbacteria bacterium]
MTFNCYLYFNGNCEEAFNFYARLFGGTIEALFTHEGTPAAIQVPPEWQKKILHARMSLGDAVLMGSDAPPGRFHLQQGFSVNIGLHDAEHAERIFNALAENAVSVTMPFGETFWAYRFGMLTDRFGIPWMINVEKAAPVTA